jgi:methionyl aminopeptidase
MDTTHNALYEGIAQARSGCRVGDISSAVQRYVESRGYSVIRQFVGHGVGACLHEAPEVPNFGVAGKGARLHPGTTIAIEPMVAVGGQEVIRQPDGWTVVTADTSLSAHYEHTIAITADGPVILTLPEL